MLFEEEHNAVVEDKTLPPQIIELKKRLRESYFADKEILDNFAENFLMPANFWWDRKRDLNSEEGVALALKAVYHFCYDLVERNEDINYIVRNLHKQCFYPFRRPCYDNEEYHMYSSYDKKKVKEGFKYPHKGLQLDLMSHERFCASPIPKETLFLIQKMEKLYEKIIAAKTDDEKMEYILESNNSEFIKQYIEMQLCSNLNDKNLWKFDIKYLENIDFNEMLQVYSKYCRYFLEDDEMKKEYKEHVEKVGGIIVPWKNPFNFETPESTESSINDEEVEVEDIESNAIESDGNEGVEKNSENENEDENDYNINDFYCDDCYYYDKFEKKYNLFHTKFRNISKQHWPFKLPLMSYIMTAGNFNIQQKLQQTCKFFFSKKQILYCYRFLLKHNIYNSPEFFKASIQCSFENHPYRLMKHKIFHIATVFELCGPYPKFGEILKNNIHKCEAKYVTIKNQLLTENELLFLIGHGRVEDFRLNKCEIKKEDNEIMLLEEILEYLPKLKILSVETKDLKTNNTLSKIKFKNKLFIFRIERLANELNPDDFCNFIKQNYIPETEIRIDFHHNINHSHLKAAVKAMSKTWIPQSEKPYVLCPDWQMENCNVI